MADPRRTSSRRAQLSYGHLKELFRAGGFDAPDLFVKDYQGIVEDFNYSADELDGLDVRITQNESDIDDLKQEVVLIKDRLNDLEYRVPELINTATSLTTSGFQIIKCVNTAPIDITLNAESLVGDTVNIKRTDGVVNVIGLIDGLTNITINVKRYSMKLLFTGTEWIEI